MHGDPPHQSVELVGRDKSLAECAASLAFSNLLVLAGVPGVGKTRIALALSSANDPQYQFVWWLRAADDAQLEASIGRLADAAGELPRGSSEQTLRALVGAMHQPGLIVFDDAESLSAVEKHIDSCGPAKVLVTTATASPQARLVRGLHLDAELEEFIRSRSGISGEEVEDLVEAVDGLPLLLLHACQFIGSNNSSLAEYLKLLDSPGSIFKAWPFQASDYERAQERIIPLSLSGLVKGSERWRELCELLALLAPAPIPIGLLEAFDDKANDFLQAAQESFVVIRNPDSQTVEVPSLIRAAIRELAGAEAATELRERAWAALRAITAEEIPEGQRDYLAEHITHLGIDPNGISAAAGLAIDLGERPLAVTMWRHAYASRGPLAPGRHDKQRVALANRLGWALLNEGLYREAEWTISRELANANEAGCISCRAPLLRLLGHLAKARRKPEFEAIRMYRAAAVATRILGGEDSELCLLLADILFACEVEVEEWLDSEQTPEVGEVIEVGEDAFLELKALRRGLAPERSAGINPELSAHWDGAEEVWSEAIEKLKASLAKSEDEEGTDGDGADSPSGIPWSPGLAFKELAEVVLHREANHETLVEISGHMVGLRARVQAREEMGDCAATLDADSRSLRASLVDQYGAESHATSLADYVEMIAAHLGQEGERAAKACRRFLIGALEATNTSQAVALLHKGLSFALQPTPDEGSTDGDRTMIRAAPWLTSLPDVEAFLWLAFQQWSSSKELPPRASVYRALHHIRRLGQPGPLVAAYLAHAFGHREHLPVGESLRYHRISVRMYQQIGMPVSDWGYGLYCYAHRLLEMQRPEPATRRFEEARELLTSVDHGRDAVLHIDAHLNSSIAPYLEGE